MTDDLSRRLRELPPRLDVPADFFDRVMGTARRRRRARWAASAAAAVLVAVVGVVLGITASGGPSTARLTPIGPATTTSTPPVSTSPSPSASPTASGSSSAAGLNFVPVSVSFVTPELGWAYGPDRPAASQGPGAFIGEVAVTHDGGQHWSALPRPGVKYFTSGGASSVRFVDSNRGYLYGDGLFETTDGGARWKALPTPGPITALATAGQQLYVMSLDCPTSAPLCGLSSLYVGSTDGSGFTKVHDVARTADARLATYGSRVFVLSSPGDTLSPIVGPARMATSNDGRHWSLYPTPCYPVGQDYAAIAAFSDRGLALVCGSEPSAGIQAKTVYTSLNGGASWITNDPPSDLSKAGYVGLLAAADANTWVLAEQRGTLLVTHDGGSTWRPATVGGLTQGVDGWSQVTFTGPRLAVAVPNSFYAGGILLSGDSGDSWSAVTFPP